jgi:hypothetical protein
MRLRSPVVHFFTLAVAVGAAATSSLGVSRPASRPVARQPMQAVVPAVLPAPQQGPRINNTFITIDRVRYQVTCKVQRFTSNTADIDPIPYITLKLRRVDGRAVTQLPAPQLTISQRDVATTITLVRTENVGPSQEVVYSGTGDRLWAFDEQLDARLTFVQRRGVTSVNVRRVPYTTVELGQPLG